MDQPSDTPSAATAPPKPVPLKIFGVGSAGVNLLDPIARRELTGATLVAVGTGPEAPASLVAAEKIVLESKHLRGPGTGGDPECARAVAEENLAQLKAACQGAETVFIVAGLGGGTGTGISPVLARAARESGAGVLGFVTLPFDCEGNRRRDLARLGLDQLKVEADGVICLPNQKAFKLIDDTTSVIDTFNLTGGLLADGLAGVWRLRARRGLIEIHFADLCALLQDPYGDSAFATAHATGPNRSRDLIDQLLSHPLLDGGGALTEADAVLVSLTGGPDLSMAEVHRVMEPINAKCEQAQVLMGAAIEPDFRERLALTVIATRRVEVPDASRAHAGAPRTPERLDTQFLEHSSATRPHSRFVPPPPTLPRERLEQLAAGRKTGRSRKSAAKMRQCQLPLEIVSKGRFDKSEPTIHKGEDLDVPTYLRRGVALN
jgi:cell division protein FtsZ